MDMRKAKVQDQITCIKEIQKACKEEDHGIRTLTEEGLGQIH
jgi:hypothetical protein